jgi:hydrogenase maturation protease
MDLEPVLFLAGSPGSEQATELASDGRPAVTVVGCGNWLQQVDSLGPMVLAALAERGLDAVLADVGTSVLGLLDLLQGQELLVLVDTCVGMGSPGSVVVCEPDLETAAWTHTSVHQVGPVETLVVAREPFPEYLPQRIVMVLLETGGLDSEEERRLCQRGVAAVERELESWRASRFADPAGAQGEE